MVASVVRDRGNIESMILHTVCTVCLMVYVLKGSHGKKMDYLVTIGEETMGGWGSGADYTNEL